MARKSYDHRDSEDRMVYVDGEWREVARYGGIDGNPVAVYVETDEYAYIGADRTRVIASIETTAPDGDLGFVRGGTHQSRMPRDLDY